MRHFCLICVFFAVLLPTVAYSQVTNDDVSTPEDTQLTYNIVANDDVPNLDPASVDLDKDQNGQQTFRTLTNGSISVNTSGVITFDPQPDYSGLVSVEYDVYDTDGNLAGSAFVNITVTPVNDPPVANNDSGSGNENQPVTVAVQTNDTDKDGTLNGASIDLDIVAVGVQGTVTTAFGTWEVISGQVRFTPVTDYTGTTSLQYTIADNDGATSNPATIQITINNVNAAPTAVDDTGTTNENVTLNINILSNDSDDSGLDAASVDLDPATGGRQTALNLAAGVVNVNSSGVVQYIPALNYNGSFTFNYTVDDLDGVTSGIATVTVTVNAVNTAPVAVGDATSTNEDTPVTLNVVSNDTDADGTINAATVDLDISTAGIQNTRSTSNGDYTVNSAGDVTYTPVANFQGVATIQYTVSDNEGAVSNAATITITVVSVNDAPVANNDATSTNQNTAVNLNVVANDTDDSALNPASVDLDPSTSGQQTTLALTEGNFTVSNSGIVSFSPATGYNGTVVISYTVADNQGATSNQATITITVIRVNSKPVANNDAATTDEDNATSFNILANDTDDVSLNKASVDLDVSTAGTQVSRTVAAGTFAVNSNGDVTFTPMANFFGSATIRYTVADNEGAVSDPANITVTVNSINDVPVATNDSRTVNEDNNAVINLLANDVDVDGTLASGSVDLDPGTAGQQATLTVAGGVFSVDGSGILTFTPNANFNGTASASYTVQDNSGAVSNVATITITINAVNDAPVAVNDLASTPQNVPVTFNVLTNDSDPDGTINAATLDLDPSTGAADKTRVVGSGTYVADNAGNVTFTPANNFNGTSSITYTVQDNTGATSNAATISVLVSFVNQAPVANNDATTTNEDTPVTLNVVTNDTDDGSVNAASVDLNVGSAGIQNTITNSQGQFTVNGSGVVTYTPALNFNGTATLDYTVNDNLGETSNQGTITITVTPVNDAPVANEDVVTGPENVAIAIQVLLNDTDVDNALDPATIDLVPGTPAIESTLTTAQGTFVNNAGIVTFTPNASFYGAANITYRVQDVAGAFSNITNIKVTITNVNDPPYFDAIANQRVFRNANTTTITITGITPGPGETESLVLVASSGNTPLVPNPTVTYSGTGATATLTFKPQPNQFGTAEVTVKAIDDGEGRKEFTRTFIITVVNVEITSTPVTVAIIGEPYQYNITTTDIPETLTIAGAQIPAWAALNSTGKNTATLAGTPPANATNATVILQLKDGNNVLYEQSYTLLIKRNPAGTSFELQTNEDVAVILSASAFLNGFTDPDNDPLTRVKFTILPKHGTALLGTTPITTGQEIPVASLTNVVYRPGTDYSGKDTLYFKVGDEFSFSAADNFIAFVIAPVNDPPEITVIEAEPLVFDIGTEIPKVITPAFEAVDTDSELIAGATIGFRPPNFDPDHDELLFKDTPKIDGTYNETTGVLTLSGQATVAEYVAAIRTIEYNFFDPYEIILTPRTIYFNLSDGTATSEEKERQISLIFEFEEIRIPNVFTPDGNGSHEVWPFASADNLEQFSNALIRVFDERGRLVHETTGFSTPWDGRKEGVEMPAGTYFYTIDLRYGRIKYNGSVTLLRAER